MFIPEIKIYATLNTLFESVRKDYEINSNTGKSFIQALFEKDQYGFKNTVGKMNALQQFESIFLKQKTAQRSLEIFMGFNGNRLTNPIPTIHILTPSESEDESKNTLGGSEESEDFFTLHNQMEDLEQDEEIEGSFERRGFNGVFSCNFNFLITSDNNNEVVLIYHFLKSLLFVNKDLLEEVGFRISSIRGQEIQLQNNLVPLNIFHKNLAFAFTYESLMPSLDTNEFTKICRKGLGLGKKQIL